MRYMLFILSLFTSLAFAEQKQVFGEYEVHYIGLTSSELDADVAHLYGIERSRALGFLNISVLKKPADGGMPVPVDAKISGRIMNLIGQSRDLKFTRIQETGALYFYSTFRFDDEDMYNIILQVTPEGQQRTYDVKFSQRFYQGL
ncbi:MAG: DUF4426 domain-containing protein [Oceanospirillaceae bacterium]|nr:DUF4426 domain-containing protein [Oceanospirillaceae bacterium]MCP5350532.1 DUF4426 domain-containing protein [Oceanospirillaceae bacterium]